MILFKRTYGGKNMSLRKKTILVLILIIAIFTLSGCKEVVQADKKYAISASDNIGLTQKIIEDVVKKAQTDGKTITALNAEGDSAIQANQVQQFIDDKYSVIAICPVDTNAIKTSIAAAVQSEIPVVIFERKVDDANVSFYAGYDAFDQGKTGAESIIEGDSGKQRVIIEVVGPDDNINATQISKGFHDAIDTASNITVIQLKSNWNIQSTYDGIKSLIRKDPTIDAIFSSNSRVENAIDEALDELGLLKPISSDDHIFRISTGGSKTGYESAAAGHVDVLMVTGADEIGDNVYEAIKALASDKVLEFPEFITKTYSLGQDQVELNKDSIWGFSSGIE
jgi:ABC-type sugar transport system substrate-binding protein